MLVQRWSGQEAKPGLSPGSVGLCSPCEVGIVLPALEV